MIYNEKYDRWVSKSGLVFKYNSKKGKLELSMYTNTKKGYSRCSTKLGALYTHRVVWETFNGDIPENNQIDHINTIRDDNRLENLRCVTPKENQNNELTKKHIKEALTGKKQPGKFRTIFGEKFYKRYGYLSKTGKRLYSRELRYFNKHKKCRWE